MISSTLDTNTTEILLVSIHQYEFIEEHDFKFRLLGLNPADSAAESFIDGISGPFWFASAIAYEESLEGGEHFCQFNPPGTGPGGELGYQPIKDATKKADGFGIMMVDPPDNRSQLWHWKLNALEGVERIWLKRRRVEEYFQAIERTFGNKYLEAGPPADYTPPGTHTTLNPVDAATIQLYNGGKKLQRLLNRLGNWETFASPWLFDKDAEPSSRWSEFNPNDNDYTRKVIVAYEELKE